MGVVKVVLTESERDALFRVALRERRSEADQAAVLIIERLRQLEALPEATERVVDQSPATVERSAAGG